MADEVQFTDEQWEAVATAAEVFAQTLEEERRNLTDVLRTNWAGNCAEGEGITANLQKLLHGESGSFSEAIQSEAGYLRQVGVQCRAAKALLVSADQSEAEKFRK